MANPERTGLPSQSENPHCSHNITIILYVCTLILAHPLPKAAKKIAQAILPASSFDNRTGIRRVVS
jgi:hypothetical protein